MTFQETPIQGALVAHLERKEDERGFFARLWCEEEAVAYGLDPRVAQSNLSYNRHRGTLRGLHYRVAPHAEAKTIRCIRGAIFDVIVDLRPSSPSYLQWFGVVLSAENGAALYVPEGLAHGFQTLEDHTEVFYLTNKVYAPAAERGVRWDDPAFGIAWPDADIRIMSERDRNWPLYPPVDRPMAVGQEP
jgi:dTDP-4-dehydrorhamnose 3,5-epimerase